MTVHVTGFDWDSGNRAKCEKHGVTILEIEQLFTRPIAILPDEANSKSEKRFRAIGRIGTGRGVFIVFTLRTKKGEVLIRPLSARYMHRKEINQYEKENPNLQDR